MLTIAFMKALDVVDTLAWERSGEQIIVTFIPVCRCSESRSREGAKGMKEETVHGQSSSVQEQGPRPAPQGSREERS